jgi:uncharacterized protein
MRNLSRFLGPVVLFCLALPTPGIAQDVQPRPVDADPALWVVRDDDTTVYLFGTVHILRPGITWFDEAVKQAFDKSDTLVLEIIDPSEKEAERGINTYAVDRSGKSLRSKLNPEQKKSYDAALKKLGAPVTALNNYKPWFGSVKIEMDDLIARGYNLNSGVEVALTEAAIEANKRVDSLETFSGQLRIFNSISEKSQIDLLMDTVKTVSQETTEMDQLVDLWAKSDPEGLAKVMNEGLPEGELRTALLTKRNANWAAWISQRMAKPGIVFVAVGAGHLSGADSVQQQLKSYKVEAKRIEY